MTKIRRIVGIAGLVLGFGMLAVGYFVYNIPIFQPSTNPWYQQALAYGFLVSGIISFACMILGKDKESFFSDLALLCYVSVFLIVTSEPHTPSTMTQEVFVLSSVIACGWPLIFLVDTIRGGVVWFQRKFGY